MADILITGGSGRLGSALRKLIPGAVPPTRDALDITSGASCAAAAVAFRPKIVIHCAAFVDSASAEAERHLCWQTNVIGTRNVIRAFQPCRFVYISSEYVFDGKRGNYAENDTPGPINFYGLTKLCGEQIVQQYPNTLIIRAGIRQDGPWRFPKAFTDQWTSDRFISEAAPDIVAAALSHEVGIIHIGGERRSVYEMARSVSDVGEMTRDQFPGLKIPRDTSLNSNKWRVRSFLRDLAHVSE